MSTGIINIIKRASLDAVENGQPTDLRYGVVTSIAPLKIQITQQFVLSENLLVIPQHLTDYTVTVDVDWGESVSGEKTIKINNALKTGDKVALLKQKGGQSYFILDRF